MNTNHPGTTLPRTLYLKERIREYRAQIAEWSAEIGQADTTLAALSQIETELYRQMEAEPMTPDRPFSDIVDIAEVLRISYDYSNNSDQTRKWAVRLAAMVVRLMVERLDQDDKN